MKRTKKYSITPDKYLNKAEVSELMSSLKRRCRDELLIELALLTGARASEILALRPSDFSTDGEQCRVFITGLKNSDDRTLPIPRALMVAILNQATERAFAISYDRLYQVWQKYTPNTDRTFHSLRHTFAVRLYDKTKNIRLVQKALGHRSIENTLVYADLVDGQKQMQEALNGLY